MTKGNKIRLIIWGTIWLFVLIATSIGIYYYYNGYGENGKIRQKLKPIIDNYNNLNNINIYKNAGIEIKAKYKNKKIRVNYKTPSSNIIFDFEYKLENEKDLLFVKYSETSDNTARVVISQMIDAIGVNNGHNEGEIFNKISYNDLYNYTLNEGILIKYDNGYIDTTLDINKSIVDYIVEKEPMYITEDELKNLNVELLNNETFAYSKKNISIYVQSNENKYIIYAQNQQYDDDLYRTIKNIINKLDINENIKKDFDINYPSISSSKEFGKYIVTVNADASETKAFANDKNIIKIEIEKTSNN